MGLTYNENSYSDIKAALIDMIPTLTDKWTDYSDSDIGIVLISLMARLSDYANYRRDKISGEVLLPTALERKNVKAILKPVGYKMHTWRCASCTAIISKQLYHDADILIPAYSKFSINTGGDVGIVYFSNKEQVVLYSNTESSTFTLTQGTPFKHVYGLNNIYNGRIYLNDTQIGENSLYLETRSTASEDAEVIHWTEVSDVVDVLQPGYYFSYDVDKNGRNIITLHPIYKSVITSSSVINIMGLSSVGSDGNMGKDKVVVVISDIDGNPFYDVNDVDVTDKISVKNTTYSTGGDEPETIEHAKVYGPLLSRTMETAVTLLDYEGLAESTPYVSRCLALDWKTAESGLVEATDGHKINLYVVPAGDYVVNNDYKAALLAYFDDKKYSATRLYVYEASYLDVTVNLTVNVNARSVHKDRALDAAKTVLLNTFDVSNLKFGQTVYFTKLIADLQKADDDIVSIAITGIDADVAPTKVQIIRLISYTAVIGEVS